MVTSNLDNPTLATTGGGARVLFWHVLYGIYLWEFFTTLDYEWSVFMGHIPYRWTIWIYSLTRVAGLMGVIFNILKMDVLTQVNCQLWISLITAFSYLSLTAASLLIVLRIIAIWERKKIPVAMAISAWAFNVVFLIKGVVLQRSEWVPSIRDCASNTSLTNGATVITVAVTDIILLLIMLVGLIRLRRGVGGTFGLAQLLWKQGLIWIFLATVAEIPPAVLLVLKMNNQFKYMFQFPGVLTMAIAATQMHRSLVYFAHGSSDGVPENFQTSGLKFANIKPPRATPISLNPIEITTQTVSEQHQTSWTGDHDFSIDIDEEVNETPSGSCLDDVERGHATL